MVNHQYHVDAAAVAMDELGSIQEENSPASRHRLE